jgi:hypothetical protein
MELHSNPEFITISGTTATLKSGRTLSDITTNIKAPGKVFDAMSYMESNSDTILDILAKGYKFLDEHSEMQKTLIDMYKEVEKTSWPDHSDIIKELGDIISKYVTFVIF